MKKTQGKVVASQDRVTKIGQDLQPVEVRIETTHGSKNSWKSELQMVFWYERQNWKSLVEPCLNSLNEKRKLVYTVCLYCEY